MMKLKQTALAIAALTLATHTFAVRNGPYFGLQMGQSKTNNPTEPVQTAPGSSVMVSPSNSGMAGRLFLGYNFNEYAAWEFGYDYYAPSKYSVHSSTGNDPAIRQGGIDLVGKGIFPFSDTGLSVFGKAGFAFVRTSTSATILNSHSGSGSNAIRPTIGVGIGYDINQRWVADLSYNHVFSGGNVKNIDVLLLGISWHWTDDYCGQFLC